MIRDDLIESLRGALVSLGVDPVPADIGLERPARREHGDWSSNVAMASAKAAGRNPRELATQLADALNAALPRHVASVEIAGPGFVNFRLHDSWLHDVLSEVLHADVHGYACPDIGGGRRVNLEFVSANPTGPLHAGHGRGACYGDALARILERVGYVVHRETYLNDRGVQMHAYAASLAARRDGAEVPEDGYHGEYIIQWAKDMPADADPFEWGYARSLQDHRETLDVLGVRFDTWFSERSMVASGAIEETLADLRAHDVVYESDGATWLRSTDFGDDKDRVLIKSDGEFTYLLPDIAYHRDKYARGSDVLINVWGADHHGYVPRMHAALEALGHERDELECIITQLVNLTRAGEPVRLSKRAGDIIELRDVLEEVGADATRLTYLLQSVDSTQSFDLELAKSQAMDNPVYYVQMAYARLRSIGRVAAERGVERRDRTEVDLAVLAHERELDVLRSLSLLPEIVAVAAADRAPHRITAWLREHAATVHGFYHDCYVLGDGISAELTQARLVLVDAAEIGLRIGLDLLGVGAPEAM